MIDYKIENSTLFLAGQLNTKTISKNALSIKQQSYTKISLKNLTALDTAGVAFIDFLRQKQNQVAISDFGNPSNENTYNYFSSIKIEDQPKPKVPGFFESIGNAFYSAKTQSFKVLLLTSEILWWGVAGIFNKKTRRKGSVIQQGILLGVDSLFIVLLLSFIIGFILALQSAVQLRRFGADVFLADLLSLSIIREMSPLMTAVIIAGRSGSSIAAEIATMKVSEEIDALKMMAINPIKYIVVPKLHAISFSMPILVTLSILIAMVGGLMVAVGYLGLSIPTFVNAAIAASSLKDIGLSLTKSIVFSWIIIVIAVYFGFKVEGGAEGVGKATTKSVVAAIFSVIVFDALFSFLYI